LKESNRIMVHDWKEVDWLQDMLFGGGGGGRYPGS
jgi:hypothetical protein